MTPKEKIAALLAEADRKLAEAAKVAEDNSESVQWQSPDGTGVYFNQVSGWTASNLGVEDGEFVWYNSSATC